MRTKPFVAAASIFLAVIGVVVFVDAADIPVTVTATPAVSVLRQNAYRWYENIDGLDPTTPAAAENTAINAQSAGTQVRLRMSVGNTGGATFAAGATFNLQFANATGGPWTDIASSTAWKFFDNPAVADGQIIVTTVLAATTVGESYGESNPSAAMPTQLLSGDVGEWDWVLVNAAATTTENWFFRMVNSSGTAFDAYSAYPKLTAVPPSGGGGPPGGTTPPTIFVGGGSGVYPSTSTAVTSSTRTSTLPTTPPLLPPNFQVADFNGDNRIDITDLSILLYYYARSDQMALRHDLNRDRLVDFPDISILMFYWTGV